MKVINDRSQFDTQNNCGKTYGGLSGTRAIKKKKNGCGEP